MHVCTIIAKNYVAYARTLADSFREHHPDGRFSVLVIDRADGYIDPAAEPFELVTPADLDIPLFDRMAASYDVLELSTAVKPWLLRHLLERGSRTVTYLDPDIWVLDRISEVDRLTAEHGLVLIPHNTEPLPQDGHKPTEEDILIAGAFNLGFISLRADEASERLLDWWSERLVADCVNDPDRGYFVDQRWIDLVPGMVPDLHILRDPGYNLAYWNLPTRQLAAVNGRYTAAGRPLRFFHFSGFDPHAPQQLSRHQTRIDVRRHEALGRLCRRYSEALLAHGHEEASRWPYDWDALPDGTPLDPYARRAFREGVRGGRLEGSVFAPDGAEEFVRYLSEPSREGSPVPRYLHAMYESRSDLQRSFADPLGADAASLIAWARSHGNGRPLLDRALRSPAVAGAGEAASVRPWGVNVSGYLTAELGVGEAARQAIAALEHAGVPLARFAIPVGTSRMAHSFDHDAPGEGPYSVNLVCVNADQLPRFADEVGSGFFAGRHSIGLWFWEVSEFPQRLAEGFAFVDEVWAASQHVADAISSRSPVPVIRMTLPVAPGEPAAVSRAQLGLPEGFCFLFTFDHNSVFERKNPLGAIEAFSRAFEPGAGPSLVVKSINGDRDPANRDRLREAAAAHADVHLIEDYVSAPEKNAMIASCDCFVSLHRSEGLGLGLAEAMYFGRPVIATGYSGNLDFMTRSNSYLVEHGMRSIGAGCDPYPAAGQWAEPDLDHAASLMRRVVDDPTEARAVGRRAAAEIRANHSPQAAGEQMVKRLRAIRQHRLAGRTPASRHDLVTAGPDSEARGRARRLLSYRRPPQRPGASKPRRAAKRLLWRLLQPYANHERQIDQALLAELKELRETLGRVDMEHAAAISALWRRLEQLAGDEDEPPPGDDRAERG